MVRGIKCVAVCCSVLQYVAVCCNVLQCVHNTMVYLASKESYQTHTSMYINRVLLIYYKGPIPDSDLTNLHAAVCCREVYGSVLQCAAVCCSVLQCWAVYYSVLLCVAVCCSVLQSVAVFYSVLQRAAVCCSVPHCVAVCCIVLQCLQCVAVCRSVLEVCCSVLECAAVCCIVEQGFAVHEKSAVGMHARSVH